MASPMHRSRERLEAVIKNVVARAAKRQQPVAADQTTNVVRIQRRVGEAHFEAELDLKRERFWVHAYKRGRCQTFCSDATAEREFHNTSGEQQPTVETLVTSNGESCIISHFNPQRCAELHTLPAERDELCRMTQLLSNILAVVQRSVGGYVNRKLDGAHTWTFARPMLLVCVHFVNGQLRLHDRDAVFGRHLRLGIEDAQKLLARASECNVLGLGLASASVPFREPLVFMLHKTLEISVASADCADSIPTAFTLTVNGFLWLTACLKLFVSQRKYVLTIRTEQYCVCSSSVDAEKARTARRLLATLPA